MNKHELLDKFLNDTEKLALQNFAENDVQREAVKKVLLFEIYHNGTLNIGETPDPLRNGILGLVSRGPALDNETLGRALRAQWEGINYLEVGFQELEKFKTKPEEEKENQDNPAR